MPLSAMIRVSSHRIIQWAFLLSALCVLFTASAQRRIPSQDEYPIELIVSLEGVSVVTLEDSLYVPRVQVAPRYPIRAQQRGISGWTLVSFTVTEDGVVDPTSVAVLDSEPPGLFDQASSLAVTEFLFEPTIEQGERVQVSGLQYLFRYELERGLPTQNAQTIQREYLPLNYISPEYPVEALAAGIEGFVLVEFTITPEGEPTGIVILERSPSAIFNASAVDAAERLRFSPRLVNGGPVEVIGARHLFEFAP